MSNSTFSLEGKVAIVTGGRRGIGKAIALPFAGAGADVAVCDLVVEGGELEAVTREIQRLGRRSLAVQTDITKKTDVDNLVQRLVDEFGGIDILVNNVGGSSGVRNILELLEEDWDRNVDRNLKGYYLCCQAVGKRMVERRKGNIINVSSTDGVSPLRGMSSSVYSIAKAGVIMLTKVLAVELASYNIRVNSIAPGWVKTELIRSVWEDPELLKQMEARIPLARIAEPGEIASVALCLASEAFSNVTGHTILVDGGLLI